MQQIHYCRYGTRPYDPAVTRRWPVKVAVLPVVRAGSGAGVYRQISRTGPTVQTVQRCTEAVHHHSFSPQCSVRTESCRGEEPRHVSCEMWAVSEYRRYTVSPEPQVLLQIFRYSVNIQMKLCAAWWCRDRWPDRNYYNYEILQYQLSSYAHETIQMWNFN